MTLRHETLEVWEAQVATPAAGDTGWRWEARCGNCTWRRVFGPRGGRRLALIASQAHEQITDRRPRPH